MMKRKRSTLAAVTGVIACGAMMALTTTASAAIVSLSSSVYDADTDISINGTLVSALNLGSASSVTHNGVTFVGGGTLFGSGLSHGTLYQGGAIDSLSSADAQTLLDSLEFGSGVGNSLVSLTGLTIGLAYEVQLIYSTNGAFGATTDIGYATPSGDLTEVYPLTGEVTGATPLVVTGTFIADETTQDLHSAVVGGLNAQVNAYQLRLVPEPGTFMLLIYCLAGVVFVRRRRAQ